MRTIVSLTFFAAALLSAPALHSATAPVHGRVLDPSGATIARATVIITSRDTGVRRSTLTDPSGAYSFALVPAGDYLLEGKAPGFGSPEPKLVTVASTAVESDIQLNIARIASEVQVTANATPQTSDEQSKAIDIVDSDQLENREVYSAARAIQYVPGLRVAQLGGPGSLVKILSRGMPVYDTSLLIDGFRLRDAAAPQGDATAYLGDLLIVDTGRVEVLRGTGSSLYGTGASAGAINIVTNTGGGRLRGDILGEGGGLGLGRGVARVAGGAFADRLAYTAGLAHLNVTRGLDGNDTYRNSSAQGFVQFALTPSTQISARIFGADTFTQLNTDPSALGNLPAGSTIPAIANRTFTPDENDPDYSRSGYYVSGLLSLLQRFGRSASARVTYQGLATSRRDDNGPAGPGFFQPGFSSSTLYSGRLDTLQARTDIQAGRYNLITAGYEFEREVYHDRSTDQNPNAAERVDAGSDIVQQSNAVFAQDQIRLLDNRLQFSVSGRVQGFSVDRPQFAGGTPVYTNPTFGTPPRAYTGDFSTSYLLPTSGTKLRMHVGNGYRAPSLFERFGSSFFFGAFSPYGDPALRPERVISLDAGFDQYFANARARVRATYFYTHIQEEIVFDFSGVINAVNDPFGRFGGYLNAKGGLARGVEMAIDTALTRSTNVTATYTYTKSQERHSTLYGGSVRAIRVFDHMFTLQAAQRFGKRFDATFDFLAASNYIFPFYVYPQGSTPFVFDGPLKADVAINYTLPLSDRYSVRLYTRIENVFNRTYYEEGFRTPKAWAVGGLKFIF